MKKIDIKDISIPYLLTSIASWLMTLIWCFYIFMLSDESSADSSSRSQFYADFISSLIKIDFPEAVVRKMAHGFEYSFLALLIFLAFYTTNYISKSKSYANSSEKVIKSDNEVFILFSLWLSTLYAISDEYHQIFVQGRSGSIVDVGVDLIGIIVMLVIIRVVYSLKLKSENKEEIRY